MTCLLWAEERRQWKQIGREVRRGREEKKTRRAESRVAFSPRGTHTHIDAGMHTWRTVSRTVGQKKISEVKREGI